MIIRQDFELKRNQKESNIAEEYKLIYPNLEMEVYENFMNTAKVVWEEFTGTSQTTKPVIKEDKLNGAMFKPPKRAGSLSMGIIWVIFNI